MTTTTWLEVLETARQLPPQAQIELAEALLRERHAALQPAATLPPKERPLEVLSGISEAELRVLAEAIVAPGHQRRLRTLLRKNREGCLSDKGREELDVLLDECDRVALLKAKALYTLTMLQRERAKRVAE